VSHLNYVGCDMLFEYDKDIHNNMCKYHSICVRVKNTLQGNIRKEMQIRLYKVLILVYIMEMKLEFQQRQMKGGCYCRSQFLGSVKEYSCLDRMKSVYIREGLLIQGLTSIQTDLQ